MARLLAWHTDLLPTRSGLEREEAAARLLAGHEGLMAELDRHLPQLFDLLRQVAVGDSHAEREGEWQEKEEAAGSNSPAEEARPENEGGGRCSEDGDEEDEGVGHDVEAGDEMADRGGGGRRHSSSSCSSSVSLPCS